MEELLGMNEELKELIESTNTLFTKLISSEKDIDSIGIGLDNTPAYCREPKWEECFAQAFLQRIPEYEDIYIHDRQGKDAKNNSLDLFFAKDTCGVEVTQAINDEFRKEESQWNKPLAQSKSETYTHIWKNQPTNLQRIEEAVTKKILNYTNYQKAYHIKTIDLFVYIVDARIENSERHTLYGIPCPDTFGWQPNECVGNVLQQMLNDINPPIPYRRIFFIFGNYWYIYESESGKIKNNIMTKEHLKLLYDKTVTIQNSGR